MITVPEMILHEDGLTPLFYIWGPGKKEFARNVEADQLIMNCKAVVTEKVDGYYVHTSKKPDTYLDCYKKRKTEEITIKRQ